MREKESRRNIKSKVGQGGEAKFWRVVCHATSEKKQKSLKYLKSDGKLYLLHRDRLTAFSI
jgi:hypothetical protein